MLVFDELDKLQALSSGAAERYPALHTFFSDRLYLGYEPGAIHSYFERVLPAVANPAPGWTSARIEEARALLTLPIPAARERRVHRIDGTLVSWYGPRIARALATLPPLLGGE